MDRIFFLLLSLDMHPYVEGVFSTAVISGITGSSSGGLQLTLESLTNYFINSGCNLETLHRLIDVAAGSLDTLPHSAGVVLGSEKLGPDPQDRLSACVLDFCSDPRSSYYHLYSNLRRFWNLRRCHFMQAGEFRKATCIGAGVIGTSWALNFAWKGIPVCV